MNTSKPWQISPENDLQKAMRGANPDVVMVPVTIVDDSTIEKSERTVQVRRGALARAALGALTGGRGHQQIRQLDFALIDSGRCRLALWQALGLEAAGETGTSMVKSNTTTKPPKDPQDAMLRAARELDHLVDDIAAGRK